MLQILYPHEETVLAAALAIFEFWNQHYIQMQSEIHTWHEVMVAAAPYAYNFNFVTWERVDERRNLRDAEAYDFDYPNLRVLETWLTTRESKKTISRRDVEQAEESLAAQRLDTQRLRDRFAHRRERSGRLAERVRRHRGAPVREIVVEDLGRSPDHDTAELQARMADLRKRRERLRERLRRHRSQGSDSDIAADRARRAAERRKRSRRLAERVRKRRRDGQ
jgi:hypothetical protein